MHPRPLLLLPLLVALPLLAAGPAQAQFSAGRVTDQLTRPILATAPAGDPRIFVVEQRGRIQVFPGDPSVTEAEKQEYLDISAEVDCCSERGLLGLAFDPDFANNGLLGRALVLPDLYDLVAP